MFQSLKAESPQHSRSFPLSPPFLVPPVSGCYALEAISFQPAFPPSNPSRKCLGLLSVPLRKFVRLPEVYLRRPSFFFPFSGNLCCMHGEASTFDLVPSVARCVSVLLPFYGPSPPWACSGVPFLRTPPPFKIASLCTTPLHSATFLCVCCFFGYGSFEFSAGYRSLILLS